MAWHEGPLAALDLEATGVDTATARIIEVGLIRTEADRGSEPIVSRLVDPGVAIPPKILDLTGITEMELAMTGGDPAEVLAETRSAIARLAEAGIPIVVYNATYDWPLLGAELERHALDPLPGVPPVILIDPLVLDRHLARFRKGKRTLGVVAAHYGVQLEGAHRADQDAEAAAALARAIAAKFPEVQVGGPELVAYQVAAHREWRDSFNEYMTRSGRAFDPITEVWPTGQPASP